MMKENAANEYVEKNDKFSFINETVVLFFFLLVFVSINVIEGE